MDDSFPNCPHLLNISTEKHPGMTLSKLQLCDPKSLTNISNMICAQRRMLQYHKHNPVTHKRPLYLDPGVLQPWQFFLIRPWTHPPGLILPRGVARTTGQKPITKSKGQSQEKFHLHLWASNFISQLKADLHDSS